MQIFRQNRNLAIIALIALVNAIGYGIIIPIQYYYGQRYGLTDFQQGLLFSLFSVCQFISTPIIGRLSDKYGRRPLLIISIAGTALSFFMTAFAPNAIILFLARALDGLTAGNIPVAMAVISDSTKPEERAKGFGLIGGTFSLGFIIGPAITGLTFGYSAMMPFLIAGAISLIAVILTAIFLPETNRHMGEVAKGKLFDFPKLWHSLRDENVGKTFLITLWYFMSFGLFIYAFQPFSLKALNMSSQDVSYLFVLFGIVGAISQMAVIGPYIKHIPLKRGYSLAIFVAALSFFGMSISQNSLQFIIANMALALSNSLVGPLTLSILSRETDEKSQGTMQGLNSSYMSIGTIFGPIIGGYMVSVIPTVAMFKSVAFPFLGSSVLVFICLWLSFNVLKTQHKESAF